MTTTIEQYQMQPPELQGMGWGRFLLQILSVGIVYIAASVPPIVILGQGSNGILASVATSMLGALVVAWFWLRRDGTLTEAWILARPASWPKTLLMALGTTIAIILWFSLGAMLVEALGFNAPEVQMVLDFVVESPLSFVLWIVVVAWLAAGLGEELLWRGFLFDRLNRLAGIKGRIWLALLIQAAAFGLPHIYQGMGGVLITGVVGLFLGWVRIKSSWSLLPCVLAHAAVDTVMMSLAYAQKLEWIAF
ncbi:type II CAAX endopeptidase family protein [Altererythrobacter arenosus]|uniref:Type II CAAX endopeptidase family protein n=1 Tax=Altererythrobacter arenosus TaxID=3032592 RepID=A0ABY8FT89_9SPHN|nr:type II CAAX endopeptidase family protein [Altererythrobacter sp. CAU 1644]WFL78237.1 type II CAAX endopeptidase family protein [Altererythrobacter sp. CAU 1644]